MAAVKKDEYPPPDADIRTVDTDKDKSNRFEGDARLRKFGFRIHSRAKNREATWIKDGQVFPYREALMWVLKEIKKLEKKYSK